MSLPLTIVSKFFGTLATKEHFVSRLPVCFHCKLSFKNYPIFSYLPHVHRQDLRKNYRNETFMRGRGVINVLSTCWLVDYINQCLCWINWVVPSKASHPASYPQILHITKIGYLPNKCKKTSLSLLCALLSFVEIPISN